MASNSFHIVELFMDYVIENLEATSTDSKIIIDFVTEDFDH